jgi:hypothetical protein
MCRAGDVPPLPLRWLILTRSIVAAPRPQQQQQTPVATPEPQQQQQTPVASPEPQQQQTPVATPEPQQQQQTPVATPGEIIAYGDRLLLKLRHVCQAEDYLVQSKNADGAYLKQLMGRMQLLLRSKLAEMGRSDEVNAVGDLRAVQAKFRRLQDEHLTALDEAVRRMPNEQLDPAFTKTRAFLKESVQSLVNGENVNLCDINNDDIIHHGVIELVCTKHIRAEQFPETLMLDFGRFQELHAMFHQMLLLAGVLSTVWQRMYDLRLDNPTSWKLINSFEVISCIVEVVNCLDKPDLASMVVVVQEQLRLFSPMGDFDRTQLCIRLLQDGMLTGPCDWLKARFKNMMLEQQGGVNYTDAFTTMESTANLLMKFQLPKLLLALTPIMRKSGILLHEVVRSSINANTARYNSLIAESVKIVTEEVDPEPKP